MSPFPRGRGLRGLVLGALGIVSAFPIQGARTGGAHEFRGKEKDERFREFLQKVKEYTKLRDSLRSGVSPVNKQDTAEQIAKHQEMLAQKIAEARRNARPGDVFTPDSQEAFRHAIKSAHSGEHARSIERTLAQGEPVKLDLYVNKPYPEKMPVTTVPPTLLQHFPRLPKNIEYRIVGDDLVLQDTESQLVIDIFSGAFPNAPPHS